MIADTKTYAGTYTDEYTRTSLAGEGSTMSQQEYLSWLLREKQKPVKRSYRKFTPKAYRKGWGKR